MFVYNYYILYNKEMIKMNIDEYIFSFLCYFKSQCKWKSEKINENMKY